MKLSKLRRKSDWVLDGRGGQFGSTSLLRVRTGLGFSEDRTPDQHEGAAPSEGRCGGISLPLKQPPTLGFIVRGRGGGVVTYSTGVPQYLRGIGSRTPWIPESMGARVPHRKWLRAVHVDVFIGFGGELCFYLLIGSVDSGGGFSSKSDAVCGCRLSVEIGTAPCGVSLSNLALLLSLSGSEHFQRIF